MGEELHFSRELLNQVVFGMENQAGDYVLDLDEGEVIPASPGVTDAHEERYLRLPEWRSVDGYNLMEKFVLTLRNPIYRERLRSILASGRGVFRQFKNAVGEREDIRRLWLSFKQREMRVVVADWLNEVRELRGLSRLELSEDEETDPLIATDFVLRDDDGSFSMRIAELDRVAFRENHPDKSPATLELLYRCRTAGWPHPQDRESRSVLAETPSGEVVGFLWSVTLRHEDAAVSVVRQIYVDPEFRGLGLAATLLRSHALSCWDERLDAVHIDLAGSACDYEDSLAELGFVRDSVSMRVTADTWFRNNE
jgi:GNAT superfamily N-acetyltransferase